MTFRSVVLGLLGAVLVCGLACINDRVLRLNFLIGNNMPASVYGVLILFVVIINARLRRWALTGRELAVILTLTLAACCIPGSGLMRTFTSAVLLPHHMEKTEPGWRQQKVVPMVPPKMLADVSRNEDEVLGGFIQGMGSVSSHVSPAQVPWYGWTRTLIFWLPIILSLWLALLALSVVIHRQWSRNEHLPYPIATFTHALLPEEGKAGSGLVRNRMFWAAAGGVCLIHLINFAAVWFPDVFIGVPLLLDFRSLGVLFPTFMKGGGSGLLYQTIFFSIIGLSYFISTDISLAFGVGPYLWALVLGIAATYGIEYSMIEGSGTYSALTPSTFLKFGACLGLFLTVVYTGRNHYAAVVRRAFGLTAKQEAEDGEVWGFRLFLILIAAFALQLALSARIGATLAILYTGIVVVFYIAMSRVIAETGLFHIQLNMFPCVVLWGLFGAGAIGVQTLLVMQLISLVLLVDPRESLMPFMVNANKLLELTKARVAGVSRFGALAVLLGLAVAVPVTLYFQYDQGSAVWEEWADRMVPKMPFGNAVAVAQKLDAQGVKPVSGPVSAGQLFSGMSPNATCMGSLAAGLGLVVLCTAGRLRYSWWPVHPLLFVMWSTIHIGLFVASFLLGCLIKSGVTRYGGSRLYNTLKPLMIGLIAGELLGAFIPSVIGMVYYGITGNPPVQFRVFPG